VDRVPAWREASSVPMPCRRLRHRCIRTSATPSVRHARCDRAVDELEQDLLDLARHTRRDLGEGQAQRDFPRTSDSSIACSLIASVTRASSPWSISIS